MDSTIEVSPKRYRYAAAERDEETGLDHMGLRYYAPWLGRWTSADPIGLGDGVNRYAYVHGNPVSMRDPGGTQTLGRAPGRPPETEREPVADSLPTELRGEAMRFIMQHPGCVNEQPGRTRYAECVFSSGVPTTRSCSGVPTTRS